MADIVDLDTYRVSFVAKTRQRLRRADRKQTRRRRYTGNLIDLETRRAHPLKSRRWRTRPQPPRQRLPAYYPTPDETQALVEWLMHRKRAVMLTRVETRVVEIIADKLDTGLLVMRRDLKALVKVVNRVQAYYADALVDGWQPSTARKEHRKVDRPTIDEIEKAILSAPRRAAPCVDPAEERRRREEFIRSLDEVEAVLTGRKVGREAE